MSMKYKFILKKDIENFPKGTVFEAYAKWDYENHKPYYNISNCSIKGKLREAVCIDDNLLLNKEYFNKEVMTDNCWDLSCPKCGSHRPLSVTAEKDDSGYIHVTFICSCGIHWGIMPRKYDREMQNYEV